MFAAEQKAQRTFPIIERSIPDPARDSGDVAAEIASGEEGQSQCLVVFSVPMDTNGGDAV